MLLLSSRRAPKLEGKRRKLTPLGWVISMGGFLLALLSYFFLRVDRFFLGLGGVLGLSDIVWAFIGCMIWVSGIMAIVTIIVLKLPRKLVSRSY